MNAQRFREKVAVVTGGNKGIGLGVSKAYAREGASVVITGRDGRTKPGRFVRSPVENC